MNDPRDPERPVKSLTRSLTQRVLVLGLIGSGALLGAVTLGLLIILYQVQVRMDRINGEAVGRFDRFFLDIQSDLAATSDGFASRPEKSSALLALLARNRACLDVFWVDADGTIRAQRTAVGRARQTKIEDAAWLKSPPGRGRLLIGPVRFEGETPFLDVASAVTDELSLPAGLMVARVDLTDLWNTTLDIKVGETGYVYIIDQAGQLVAFRSRRLVTAGKTLPARGGAALPFTVALAPGIRRGLTGELALTSSQPLTTVPWFSVLEQPVKEAFAPLIWPGLALLATLVLVGLVLFNTIGFARNHIVTPLLNLRDAVGRMADGDLGQSVPVLRHDELGQLGHSFNRMAGQLQKAFLDLEARLAELGKAQAALTSAEAKARKMLEKMPLPLAHVSKDGEITFRNERFVQLLGYTSQDVPSVAAWWSRAYPEPTYRASVLARWEAAVRRANSDDGDIDRHEYQVTCKDGKVRTMDIFGIALGDELIVTFMDLTERKRLEEQLRQAQKMEAIGQLAGGIAHDFNNILAAMTLQLDFIAYEQHLDPATRAGLAELKAGAKRAASLTRQLLLFSRRSPLEIKILDPNEVVANLLKMLGRVLGEHITLVFERKDKVPAVEADVGMLEQVFMNLVVNARDAMPQGGRITLAAESVEFDSGQAAARPNRRSGRFVCLSVADTGCGMPPDTLGRIFEPFFTTKEVGKGTGLGLATVYGIVAQHNGWLEVNSEVGRGSTFSIYLPVSARAAENAERQAAVTVPRGKETLLVVEDDRAVRQVLIDTLTGLGYRVLSAVNGQEAMARWREQGSRIDLLFTDLVMPGGITGLELAEALRREKPDLRIIVSSGYSADGIHLGRLKLEGICYLPKPYDISELGAIVRRCLNRQASLVEKPIT